MDSLKGEWRIVILRNDKGVYVQPKGSISFLTVDTIERQVYDFIRKDDTKLVIDLSKVNFLDSAGLGMLISFLKHMKSQNGIMIVEYPQLGVQKLLEMTRMDELFEIKKTPEPSTGNRRSPLHHMGNGIPMGFLPHFFPYYFPVWYNSVPIK
jgi:anti-sigma B factor antagonist